MDVTKAVATMQGGSLAEFLRENPDQGILLGIIIVLIFAVAFLAWCACVGNGRRERLRWSMNAVSSFVN